MRVRRGGSGGGAHETGHGLDVRCLREHVHRPRGAMVELMPEGDNPTDMPQTYPVRNCGFFISGVALAVFKAVD